MDNCKAREGSDDLMSNLIALDSNIMIKERSIVKHLSKKTLREILLSEGPPFMEGLKAAKEDVLTTTLSQYIVYIYRSSEKIQKSV